MNQLFNQIGTFVIGIAVGGACIGSYLSHDYSIRTPEEIIKTEYVYIEQEPGVIYEKVPCDRFELRTQLTEQDGWYYKDLAMREGEGEGVIGMLWVMYVGECRCEAYSQTVKEMWESDAFKSSMCRTGRTPNEDCLKAYEMFVEGWTPKPLYLRANSYHNFGTPLCNYGNHCFSTR